MFYSLAFSFAPCGTPWIRCCISSKTLKFELGYEDRRRKSYRLALWYSVLRILTSFASNDSWPGKNSSAVIANICQGGTRTLRSFRSSIWKTLRRSATFPNSLQPGPGTTRHHWYHWHYRARLYLCSNPLTPTPTLTLQRGTCQTKKTTAIAI